KTQVKNQTGGTRKRKRRETQDPGRKPNLGHPEEEEKKPQDLGKKNEPGTPGRGREETPRPRQKKPKRGYPNPRARHPPTAGLGQPPSIDERAIVPRSLRYGPQTTRA